MISKKNKGCLIFLEGSDFSGKTTQSELLFKYLKQQGLPVIKTKEPGATNLGKQIRQILLFSKEKIDCKAEAFLFSADRSEHYNKIIIPNLNKHKIVISDRNWPSTIAYQGFGRGISLRFLDYLRKEATYGIKPDLIIFLDIIPSDYIKVCKQRQETRHKKLTRFEQEKLDFHKKVRRGFLYLANKDTKHWKIINANQPVDKVFQDIQKIVDYTLKHI